MRIVFLIAYIVIGITQIWAGIEGMQLYFGIAGFPAAMLLLVAYGIPVFGTIALAFLACYGARYGWKWEWWQALMLVAPGIVFVLAAGVTIGLAIWAQRLGWLISLHHRVAGSARNEDV